MCVLLIAEHDHKKLSAGFFPLVTAAREIQKHHEGPLTVLVVGQDCRTVAEEAAKISGVDKVLLAEDPAAQHFLAENLAPRIAELARDYHYILATATSFGKNLAPRIAALLDVQQVSEIVAIESATRFIRPIYAGNALAYVETSQDIQVITVRGTAFAPISDFSGSAPIETIEGFADQGVSQFVSYQVNESTRPELASAKIIISGGRGLASAENFHLLEKIADLLNAGIGASRAAVDAGYVPNDYQIGQTGKVVAPDLYIAVGISGAIQHLAGMKDSKVIVAINKDEDAPIFQVADYGLVADLFTALPELEQELRKTLS